ncbi:MAG: hypothetical protein ABEJ00_02095, partial [Gemmatimonadota bacterium]
MRANRAGRRPGWTWLLRPKLRSAWNDALSGEGAGRSLAVGGAAVVVGGPLGYWGAVRFLRSLREVPEVGAP